MYLFINAIKNIGRNKGRNIIIGVIMLALITVSIISLCINNTTASIIDDYKSRFGSEVNIAPDMSKLTGLNDYSDFKPVTINQYVDFANSEYLNEAIITGTVYVSSEGIVVVDNDELDTLFGVSSSGEAISSGIPTMALVGNKWDDFNKGYRSLINGGSMPKNSGECIISKEVADLNNLIVGDEINLVSSSATYMSGTQITTSNTIKVKITGIYIDATEEYSSSMRIPFMNRRNEILTPIETLIEYGGDDVSVTAEYLLKNPAMLKGFEAELRAKGLAQYYLVSTDEAGYQKIVGPVEGLKKISLTFMFIVLAFGAVIIVLISSIAIRERKYEIGVLRAIGMKKRRVIFGLWGEMLMITACSLIIGFGIGSALAQPVSDTLLAGQIENAKTTASQINTGTYSAYSVSGIYIAGAGGTMESIGDSQEPVALEQVDVSVGIDTIIEIAIIALLLASLASLVAAAKVVKYEPIKILMERN